MKKVTLSVIMPCFNVASTLDRALESVFMQKGTFEFEVIIIDDKSTDDTKMVARQWQHRHPGVIEIIENEKNEGNALSFYKGLCMARGECFCVLDGDDYYTLPEKFQKQIDFLEQDKKQEYVGVCHYYVFDLGNNKVNVPQFSGKSEFNYPDILTCNTEYYHTATYIYRNIFKGQVLEYFSQQVFRGDTVRTMFHLMYSNKKIKVLGFYGSAYSYNFEGIWSGITKKQQAQRTVDFRQSYLKLVHTTFEKKNLMHMLAADERALAAAGDDVQTVCAVTIDEELLTLKAQAETYAFSENLTEFVFQGVYYSQTIDSLCATLGCIYRQQHPQFRLQQTDPNQICIVIGIFVPNGGGIFREILEIAALYPDKKVTVLATNMEEVPEVTRQEIKECKNVSVRAIRFGPQGKLEELYQAYHEIAPTKTYFYTSHNDPFGMALIQPGSGKNVCLFSFDYGFLCGITNPYIDTIVAKRPTDYKILRKHFDPDLEKVVYIPTWNRTELAMECAPYKPFCDHDKLITASAAARFYKLESRQPYNYLDMVLELLTKTGGKHYHFGPLPEEKLIYVQRYLKEHGLEADSFVWVPWAKNLGKALLEDKVDVFIEPFPVVSYKITLEALANGIPVYVHRGITRISVTDFIYQNPLTWKMYEDFAEGLIALDEQTLLVHSRRAKKYFDSYHSEQVVKKYFLNEQSLEIPCDVKFVDDVLQKIEDFSSLFRWIPPVEPPPVEPPPVEPRVNPAPNQPIQEPETKPEEFLKKVSAEPSVEVPTEMTEPVPAREDTSSLIPDSMAVKPEREEPEMTINTTATRLQRIYKSMPYKLGFALTWLPRTVMVFCERATRCGISQALRTLCTTDYLSMGAEDDAQTLERVMNSITYRLGIRLMSFFVVDK